MRFSHVDSSTVFFLFACTHAQGKKNATFLVHEILSLIEEKYFNRIQFVIFSVPSSITTMKWIHYRAIYKHQKTNGKDKWFQVYAFSRKSVKIFFTVLLFIRFIKDVRMQYFGKTTFLEYISQLGYWSNCLIHSGDGCLRMVKLSKSVENCQINGNNPICTV